jgi:hypothetical protein
MADFSKADAVRILTNLDTMSAGHIPARRRAWAHLFIAMGLIQTELPNPEQLTRERFMELAGKVWDKVYGALASSDGPSA